MDLCAGERHRDNVLQSIGANLEGWSVQVKREKAIYHTLNKCRCGCPCVTLWSFGAVGCAGRDAQGPCTCIRQTMHVHPCLS